MAITILGQEITDEIRASSSWFRGKDLGDGLVHRGAYEVARSIVWDTGRTATG